MSNVFNRGLKSIEGTDRQVNHKSMDNFYACVCGREYE